VTQANSFFLTDSGKLATNTYAARSAKIPQGIDECVSCYRAERIARRQLLSCEGEPIYFRSLADFLPIGLLRKEFDGVTTTDQPKPEAFSVGQFEVSPRLLTVHGPSGSLALQPRVMAVLVALAVRQGAVVTRDELTAEVWQGRIVSDDALNRCIAELRRVLRESAESDPILTVPRVGYRLALPVSAIRFETRPGETMESQHGPASPPKPAPGLPLDTAPRNLARLRIFFLAIGALVALGAAAWWGHTRMALAPNAPIAPHSGVSANKEAGPVPPPGTVAVMRFANLGAKAAEVFLVDGISEEVLDRLASVPDLHVVARSSSFNVDREGASALDAKEIGRLLRVRYIVDGSVRHEATELRVSVRVIDGTSGQLVWTQAFTGQVDEVYKLQAEIGRRVAEQLQFSGVLRVDAVEQTAPSPEAYASYLRGRYSFQRRRDAAGTTDAVREFEAAITADPKYAMAHAWLAASLAVLPTYSDRADKIASIERAEEQARVALRLDPQNAVAYAVSGFCELGIDPLFAERNLQHALRLNPNLVDAHQWYHQLLLDVGRIQSAIDEGERALSLDPLAAPLLASLAQAYYLAGDLPRALLYANRSQQIGVADINQVLSKIAFAEGRLDESARLWAAGDADDLRMTQLVIAGLADVRQLEKARAGVEAELSKLAWPQRGWSQLNMRLYVGDISGALAALDELDRRVGSRRALQYFFSADLWDPESQIKTQYADDRFQKLLSRTRLLAYFRESGTTPDRCIWSGEALRCVALKIASSDKILLKRE
jgi:TolB-like protein/DNA-binding winged helix-turn-helix (wHTH) protein/Tfp pilus assembly protein PilF